MKLQSIYSKKHSTIKNQKGMTLLEIMIVIVIIGSLGAILGNKVIQRQKKAQVTQTRIQISEIAKQLDMYYTDCLRYPTTEQGLSALLPGGESTCPNNGWGPEPYFKKIPLDSWGGQFYYTFENGNYRITSYGSDQQPGGEGNAKDLNSDD